MVYSDKIELERVPDGEGYLIVLRYGSVAVYREGDDIHTFRNACTHRGCELEWNGQDKTWDCPSHGSRFSATGEVLCGPATEPLERHAAHVEGGFLIID